MSKRKKIDLRQYFDSIPFLDGLPIDHLDDWGEFEKHFYNKVYNDMLHHDKY